MLSKLLQYSSSKEKQNIHTVVVPEVVPNRAGSLSLTSYNEFPKQLLLAVERVSFAFALYFHGSRGLKKYSFLGAIFGGYNSSATVETAQVLL